MCVPTGRRMRVLVSGEEGDWRRVWCQRRSDQGNSLTLFPNLGKVYGVRSVDVLRQSVPDFYHTIGDVSGVCVGVPVRCRSVGRGSGRLGTEKDDIKECKVT